MPGVEPFSENEASGWSWVTALVLFASGAPGGFFLTALPLLTPDNWSLWVGGRIAWQLGSGVWLGFALCGPLEMPDCRWKGAGLGALAGLALCFNPVLDVFVQPRTWEGTVASVEIDARQLWRAKGSLYPGIDARIGIGTPEGELLLRLSGRQANRWGEFFLLCRGRVVRVTILPYLQAVLEAEVIAEASSGR